MYVIWQVQPDDETGALAVRRRVDCLAGGCGVTPDSLLVFLAVDTASGLIGCRLGALVLLPHFATFLPWLGGGLALTLVTGERECRVAGDAGGPCSLGEGRVGSLDGAGDQGTAPAVCGSVSEMPRDSAASTSPPDATAELDHWERAPSRTLQYARLAQGRLSGRFNEYLGRVRWHGPGAVRGGRGGCASA
jgi:hypothetical protein